MKLKKNLLLPFIVCILPVCLVISSCSSQSKRAGGGTIATNNNYSETYAMCLSILNNIPQFGNASPICRCVAGGIPAGTKTRQELRMKYANQIFQCIKTEGDPDPYAPETKEAYRQRCVDSLRSQNISEYDSIQACSCAVRVTDSTYVEIMEKINNFDDWNAYELWRNSILQKRISGCMSG